MSFLSRFFKPQAPLTVEQKIEALSHKAATEIDATANDTAAEDALRVAAIGKLDFGATLKHLALTGQGQIQTAARKRIGALLDSGGLKLEQLKTQLGDQQKLIELCGYSNQIGPELVESLSDESALLSIAENGSTSHMRQAAAQKVESRKALENLQKVAKNRDKSVYKITKQKLEKFKEEKARLAKLTEEVRAVCHQAEQLFKRNIDDIFHARKAQIEDAWAQVSSNASSEEQQRYAEAMQKCQAKLDEIAAMEKAKAEQEEAERAAKKELLEALEWTQKFIADLYSAQQFDDKEDTLNRVLAVQNEALKDAEIRGLNVAKEKGFAQKLKTTVEQLLIELKNTGPVEELIKELKESKEYTGQKVKKSIQSLTRYAQHLKDIETPAIVKEANEAVDQWTKQAKEKSERLQETIKESSELIRRGQWSVSKGLVGRSRAILRDLDEKLEHIDELPNHLQNKYEDLKASIEKLGDWHEFAVTPKKEALIKEVQSLENSELHPKDLATKVQNLQDRWKELSRGGQNQDEDLWRQFQEAAQKAYEPCKAYFEEQSKQRDDNADKRRQLIEQLKQYQSEYDWDNANWKEVEKTLRVSREAWQSYWPVPRKDIKSLQSEFDGIMDNLYSNLHGFYERNRVKKAAIVEQAESLAAKEDTQEAIEQAKQLQSQWKNIGQCKRKDDQALWKRFRAACDGIFERRDLENEAQKEEREKSKAEAEAIIDKIEAMLSLRGEAFFTAKSELDSLSESFQNLGELPRDSAKAIFQRYHKALENIQSKTEYERRQANFSVWRELMKLASALNEFELNNDKDDNSKQAMEEAMSSVTKWPSGTHEIIEQRFTQSLTEPPQAKEEKANALRLLCIRSEIATDKASPESDKQLRMEYQVAQLQQGLGQAESQNPMTDLIAEWLAVDHVDLEQYQQYEHRFLNIWSLEEQESELEASTS